ncbi:hypothetical protein TSOC_000758 [Tetrabaena socialis]|uniref:Uncharacterized protein n=1 Tax=Tetrabaena socialis TaxID=47790 RepID=A0A2J8AIF2_9CHLO|nr:hypothetical protein TSOC_000758 [Tetrabaena socialis]|eukprot:PNH12296.1 hypothetical protein TSOC_000758 [Tetrabaena socialis]
MPVLPDSEPCALTGGQRYMFFLQVGQRGDREGAEAQHDIRMNSNLAITRGAKTIMAQPGDCPGYYFAMFSRAYHTIRRPLGGTGCAFYPGFPVVEDMITRVNGQCSEEDRTVPCDVDRCDPLITKSPCANDTNCECDLKLCGGKYMYYNAILPSERCYELYTYKTSGLPVNCYGQRYINNRIREIELQQALANMTAPPAARTKQIGDEAGVDTYN